MKTRMIALAALAGIAAGVSAQSAGDILFTSHNLQRSGGIDADFIGLVTNGGASSSALYTVPLSDTTSRLSGIGRNGTGGFIFGNQPFPAQSNTGEVFFVGNLFSGSGSRVNLAQGGVVNSPHEFAYHAPSNSMIVVNNPAGTGLAVNPTDGISALQLGTNIAQQIFAEPPDGSPAPRYNAGHDIIADPARPGSYYVLAFNRGVDGGFSDNAPSTLHRLTVNNDLSSVSVSLIQDFSASVVGQNLAVFRATSLNIDPATGDVLVSEGGFSTTKIVRVGIDGVSGDSTGVSLFADIQNLRSAAGLTAGGVEEIEWDPFNNRWLLVEDIDGPNYTTSRIMTLDADGLGGYGLYFEGGFAIRDIEVVPTPGSALVMALGGLVATRRRR